MPQAPRLAAPARIARPRIAHQRNLVDFRLQRLAVLSRLRRGAVSRVDVCDADPYLVRSAKFHGEPSRRPCPVCRRSELDLVTYVFGDELGQFSGRIRSRDEVAAMSTEVGEVDVYVVEVCQGCSWNHLDLTFTIGDGVPRRPPRRQRTAEDDWP